MMSIKSKKTIEHYMHSKVDIKLQTTELTTSEIIEMFNISTKNAKNLLSHLKKCFGGSYNPNSKYLIVIQGSSSSGKSTIANNLNRLLNACGIESYLLEIDKYYKTFETPNNCENTEEYVKSYDFDNPAAIDWTKVYGVLKAIEQDAEYLPTYDYSFITKKSNGPIKIKNKYPKVVIVEGIYAMNTISEQIFNVEMFDAFNSAKEIKKEFVKNKNLLLGYNKIKLRLTMCKHKSQRVRTGRDVLQRGKTKEMATYQFLNQVWPATTKWVNNTNFKEDIKIVHGSFNNKKVRVMLALFTFYFTGKYTIYKEAKYDTDCFEDFSVECSGECSKKSSFCIVLDDT